jgi:hypothetical protein
MEKYPKSLWNRDYLLSDEWIGVWLHSVVSDFPVLHLAYWVGIFRCAFLPHTSSLPCYTLGSLVLWLEDPSTSGSDPSSHRLSIPIVFQRFLLGVLLIFQGSTLSFYVFYWLLLGTCNPGFTLDSHGLRLMIQWRLQIPLPVSIMEPPLKTDIGINLMKYASFLPGRTEFQDRGQIL